MNSVREIVVASTLFLKSIGQAFTRRTSIHLFFCIFFTQCIIPIVVIQ